MGIIKGQTEYQKWVKGGKLTRAKAVFSNCYICNGFEDSSSDCLGKKDCPIYPYSPSGKKFGA